MRKHNPPQPRLLALALHAALLAVPTVGSLSLLPQAAQAQSAPATYRFDIPAGPLSTALTRIAAQAGVQLTANAELTAGKNAPAIQGGMSLSQALERALAGSGLQLIRSEQGGYTLRQALSPAAPEHRLGEIQVTARALGNPLGKTDGYLATHSSVATKTSKSLLETSQSVSVVTREQMDEQGSPTVQQAMRYTPGIFTNQIGASGRYDYVVLRGFADSSIDNIYLDGLKSMGDPGTFSSIQIDPYFLERIDIVKGPSSVLYGRSAPGGLVALTSKKPLYEPYREIQAGVGTHDQKALRFDFGGPLDKDGTLAYRLVGLAEDADTQTDHVGERRYAIAPTLTVNFTDATALTLQAYLQRDPKSGYHSGVPAEGSLYPRNGRLISRHFFDGEPGLEKFDRRLNMYGWQLEHRFNDVWSARQNFRYLDSKVDSDQVYGFGWTTPTSDSLTRFYSGSKERLDAYIVDNLLQADFATGAVKHTVLLGLDYQKRNARVDWPGAVAAPLDAFAPVYGSTTLSFPWFSSFDRRLEQTGLYLQDLLEYDRWRLSLGLRQDRVNISVDDLASGGATRDKHDALSGRAGLLYLFDNGVAPYLSYSNSFNPNSFQDAAGKPLKPTEGEQWELGMKYQPTGSRSQLTAAWFDITQRNLASKQPQDPFWTAIGEIRARGLELEGHLQASDNFRLLAGYTYTDIEYVRALDGTTGNTPNQSPGHTASLWGHYLFDGGNLAGLSLGAGLRYTGKQWADKENTLRVPSYALLDLSIAYDLSRLGLAGMDLQLNANNLLNKKYVASCFNLSFCYFGAERNVGMTLRYKF